jgi:hypothetical protein
MIEDILMPISSDHFGLSIDDYTFAVDPGFVDGSDIR